MHATAALAALLLAFGGAAPLAPPAAPTAELEFFVLAELQSLRLQHSQSVWRADGRLAAAARRHSDDMARRHYFAHASPEGRRVGDRAAAAGYAYQSVAETLYWATPAHREHRDVAARTVQAWLESPAHRDVLLDDALADIGVGVSLSGERVLVTLVAARRAGDS